MKLRGMEPFHNNPTFTSCENCKSDMCAQKNACLLKSARGLKKRTKTLGRIFDALTMLAMKERSTQWRQLPDGNWTQDAKDIKVKPPPVNISRGQQGTRSRYDKRRKANLLPENLTKSPAGSAKLAPTKIGKVKPYIVRAKRHQTTEYAPGVTVKIKKNPNTGRLEQVPGRRIVVHRKGDVIKVGDGNRHGHEKLPILERHKALPDELVDRLQKAESKVYRKIKEKKGKIVHKTKGSVDLITPKPAGPLDSRQINKKANMTLTGHEAAQARVNPKKKPPRNPRRPEVTGKENLRAGRQLQPARGKDVLVKVDIPGSLNDLDRIEKGKLKKKKEKVKRRKGPQKGVRGGGRGVNPSLLGKDKSTPLSVMKKHGNMKSTKIEKIARSKGGLKKAARILANTVRKAR